jgi:hypothetical protein
VMVVENQAVDVDIDVVHVVDASFGPCVGQ